jgi:hypothetical protein
MDTSRVEECHLVGEDGAKESHNEIRDTGNAESSCLDGESGLDRASILDTVGYGGVRRQTILWNGRKYHRYPDSKRRQLRVYFYAHYENSPSALHRDVWEFFNGKIPVGIHVHHKHGTDDNRLSSLEIVTTSEHGKRRWKSVEDLARKKRYLTKSTAMPPEVVVARRNARVAETRRRKEAERKEYMDKVYSIFKCEDCGVPLRDAPWRKHRICKVCREKRRHLKRYIPTPKLSKGNCKYCGKPYVDNRQNVRFCSKGCRHLFAMQRQRERYRRLQSEG